MQKCEFKAVETVSASCESDGYTVYECEICNGRYKELIPAKGHKLITKTKKATFSDNGYIETVCSVCQKNILPEQKSAAKAKTENGRIIIPQLKSVRLSANTYVWDGALKKPAVTVYDVNGSIVPKENYTVKYQNNSVASSNAKVIVTFKGNYEGTKTLKFSIVKKSAKKTPAKGGVIKKIASFFKKLFRR